MSNLYCKWINPDSNQCDIPAEPNKKFCYRHIPMAYAGYPHTEAADDGKGIITIGRPQTGNSSDYRVVPRMTTEERNKHWTEGMERNLSKYRKENGNKKKFRSTLWVQEDFPRYIDGIYFQCLEEYEDFVYGQYDASSTEHIDEMDYPASPSTKAWLGQGSSAKNEGGDGFSLDQDEWDVLIKDYEKAGRYIHTGSSYTEKKLEKGSYTKLDTIQHMHYYIARGQDDKYYSVWVSCTDATKLDSIMAEVLTKMPCGVTSTEGGRYHTSEAYFTYGGADSRFSCGGESFYNIRTRIERVSKADWLPPNIRKLAFDGKWEFMPAEYEKAARSWKKAGCPGWYGGGTWKWEKGNYSYSGSTDNKTKGSTTVTGFGQFTKFKQRGKGISVMKHKPLLGAAPVLRDPKEEMRDFLAKTSGGVLSEKDARPLLVETAKKGDTGCRMRLFDGTPCGKAIIVPPYCDKHNIQLYGSPAGRSSVQ